jgi:hypothetical protein
VSQPEFICEEKYREEKHREEKYRGRFLSSKQFDSGIFDTYRMRGFMRRNACWLLRPTAAAL